MIESFNYSVATIMYILNMHGPVDVHKVRVLVDAREPELVVARGPVVGLEAVEDARHGLQVGVVAQHAARALVELRAHKLHNAERTYVVAVAHAK